MSDLKAIDSTFDDYTGYQDAAIVVIGRPSSETYDFWKGGVKDGLGMKEPLQLSTDEKAIIEEATDKFDKVIVLLNSASPMDVSELQNNEKIQSIAYIGQPGIYGLLGVAQVLSGKATPSGKLPDTWASNQLSIPAMVNFGDYTFSNASDITRSTVIGLATTSHKYVVEAEGLFTGYKYYETRYSDVIEKRGNACGNVGVYSSDDGVWSYDREVTYPFGYGLSYTTFEEHIRSFTPKKNGHDYTVDVQVEVKNVGTVEGSDVVEVYGSAPYNGTLEKSAIQLLDFEKTNVLKPQESQTLHINVDLQNLATYDMNYAHDGVKGGYVL